jgi:hypothetical protein
VFKGELTITLSKFGDDITASWANRKFTAKSCEDALKLLGKDMDEIRAEARIAWELDLQTEHMGN